MGIILDVIVIAIFALNIFICYKKGLVRLAVGLIAVLTAIVLSIILYKPISNLVIKNTGLDKKIENVIIENFSAETKDGQEVIDLFEKSEVNEFDFILMDIMMPKLNGLDATRKIRSLKRQDAKTVPIIAMSANAFVEDIMNSKIAGMNMHLAKPLDETKLINALKQCKKDEDFK